MLLIYNGTLRYDIYSVLYKVFGRFHRFPAQSLSVSGSFCVICIEYMLHSP